MAEAGWRRGSTSKKFGRSKSWWCVKRWTGVAPGEVRKPRRVPATIAGLIVRSRISPPVVFDSVGKKDYVLPAPGQCCPFISKT